jgi:hypothetical protein
LATSPPTSTAPAPAPGKEPTRRKPLSKPIEAIALAVFSAVLATVLARNADWLPPYPDPSPQIYPGRVIFASQARIEARPAAPPEHAFISDSRLHILGFCIGAAVRDPVTEELDQRWFVLKSGLLLPEAYAYADRPQQPPLRGCVHEHDPVGGPTAVQPQAHLHHGMLSLQASSPQASTIGFAVLEPHTGHWRPVALREAINQPVRVKVRAPHAVEAMAVACWGPEAPAFPSGDNEPVVKPQPLRGESAALVRAGLQLEGNGARMTCAPGHYGLFPKHPPSPPPKPRKHAAPGNPASSHESAAPRSAPSVSEAPQRPTASEAESSYRQHTNTSTTPREPRVTTGPEESIGVGQHK